MRETTGCMAKAHGCPDSGYPFPSNPITPWHENLPMIFTPVPEMVPQPRRIPDLVIPGLPSVDRTSYLDIVCMSTSRTGIVQPGPVPAWICMVPYPRFLALKTARIGAGNPSMVRPGSAGSRKSSSDSNCIHAVFLCSCAVVRETSRHRISP